MLKMKALEAYTAIHSNDLNTSLLVMAGCIAHYDVIKFILNVFMVLSEREIQGEQEKFQILLQQKMNDENIILCRSNWPVLS